MTMKTQLIVSQKISDLALHVRMGTRKPARVGKAQSPRVRDAVTLSKSADLASQIAKAIPEGEDEARQERVAELKRSVNETTYVIDENMAEDIAVRILNTIM
jgi:anti-sigma28 factor (negative regulator of flagellin synthesis)